MENNSKGAKDKITFSLSLPSLFCQGSTLSLPIPLPIPIVLVLYSPLTSCPSQMAGKGEGLLIPKNQILTVKLLVLVWAFFLSVQVHSFVYYYKVGFPDFRSHLQPNLFLTIQNPDFEWSGFQMVGTIALAKTWLWKPDYLKSDLHKVLISNGRIADPH